MYAPADHYIPQSTPRALSLRKPLLVWSMMAAAALACVGLIVAAPLALAHGYKSFGTLIYDIFSYLCHQIPGRSFHLEGHSFAVCSRCTGLYAGFAAGILSYPLVRSLRQARSPRRRLWLLLAAVPVTIDFIVGYLGFWQNNHFSRFTTAALLGAVCAFYVVPGVLDFSRIVWLRLRSRKAHEVHP